MDVPEVFYNNVMLLSSFFVCFCFIMDFLHIVCDILMRDVLLEGKYYIAANGKIAKKTTARRGNAKEQHFSGQGVLLFLGFRKSCWIRRKSSITTELCSGFQGARSAREMIRWIIFSEGGPAGPGTEGGANQQAFCNSARMALLAGFSWRK
ncbi:MAG: hypothetical protein IJ157_02460 [Clostridia bacterium]|nr:hypothetical protein [Clostridia bacterium]